LKFALEGLRDDQVPVVFQIDFRGSEGLFEMTKGYTAFPEEDEVLIQDGLQYQVISNTEEIADHEGQMQRYQLIRLQYPVKT